MTITTDVTPDWLAQLGNWERATRTPLVLGLNLGLADAANAASLAQAAVATPAARQRPHLRDRQRARSLRPADHLPRRRAVAWRGCRSAPTPTSTPSTAASSAHTPTPSAPSAPGIALSAGGFASTSWEDHEDDLLSNSWLPVFSTHAYALPTCGAATRRRSSRYYTARLLSGRTYQPLVSRAAQLSAVATAHGAAVRVSEANTAICGGVHKGSDTFAAALWGTDVLFGMAEAGVRNVDLHTLDRGVVRAGRLRARPGAHRRAGAAAVLRDAPLRPRDAPRRAPAPRGAERAQRPARRRGRRWMPRGRGGSWSSTRTPERPHKVVLRVPGAGDRARVERLVAPSVGATRGVTFAGQGYVQQTPDGRLRGRHVEERVVRRSGAFRVLMPAGSAALVTVPSR